MESQTLLQRIINAYSKKNSNWIISYSQLLSFVNNLVINDESGRYSVFSTNTSDVITAMLIDLENSGCISLEYTGGLVDYIKNHSYLNQMVKSAYISMESNSDYPFPTQSSLGLDIPDNMVITLRLPDDLSSVMKENTKNSSSLYKIFLSGDLSPVIAEGEMIRNRALVLAVNKIRNYLAHKNNAN